MIINDGKQNPETVEFNQLMVGEAFISKACGNTGIKVSQSAAIMLTEGSRIKLEFGAITNATHEWNVFRANISIKSEITS